MKKKWLIISVVLVLLVGVVVAMYLNRPMTMNDLKGKPNITGTVMEVSDGAILVMTYENEMNTLYSVSLDTELKDSMNDFDANQQVKVYYDGIVLESYPMQIQHPYAILLVDTTEIDLAPMVMIKGKIYYDTNKLSDIISRCGVMDGEIRTEVKPSMIPTEDDQSNFGTGYSYQFVDENNVDILINEKFYRFTRR